MNNHQREIRICRDPQDLNQQAAALFVRLAAEAIAASGHFRVALSGGSTPKGVYGLLASPEVSSQISWSQVHLFWGDERCVLPTDPESNYHMVEETLIKHVPIPVENVRRMPTEYAPLQIAEEYEEVLREAFALSADNPWPRFDLIFLGLGDDGHTASLFPNTVGLHEKKRLMVADYVDKVQAWRVTLTPPVLNHAAHVVFLVSGSQKAAIVKDVVQGPMQPERLPAQLVQPEDGTLLWLVDKAAAALL